MLALVSTGWCINYNNWGGTDIDPLLRRELPYDMIHFGAGRDGVSTMVSGSLAIPLGYSIVHKQVYSNKGLTLADGVPGQVITIDISVYSNSDGAPKLTPTTKTGFASISFDAVGDSVTLWFHDSTIGWTIIGTNSVTVNQ